MEQERPKIETDPSNLRKFNLNITNPNRALRIGDLLWKELQALQSEDISAIGLAAPQVAINARVAVLINPQDHSRIDLINPSYSYTRGPVFLGHERCLSIPDIQYLVPRWSRITVQTNMVVDDRFEQNVISVDATSGELPDILLCRSLQHEIDHLEGILITDYIPESKDPRIREVMTTLFDEQQELYKKAHTPIRRNSKKIGRNDPCPCKSGKKYKHCCLISPVEI